MATSSFSARIPEDLHERIKDDCAARGISQADFLVELATAHYGIDATGQTIAQRVLNLEIQMKELLATLSKPLAPPAIQLDQSEYVAPGKA